MLDFVTEPGLPRAYVQYCGQAATKANFSPAVNEQSTERYIITVSEYRLDDFVPLEFTDAEVSQAIKSQGADSQGAVPIETIMLSAVAGAESMVQFGRSVTVTTGRMTNRDITTRQTQQRKIGSILRVTVKQVRPAAEYYRDIIGFHLDPVDGVFQPSSSEPDGVYGIVKKGSVWVHFQFRREDIPPRKRTAMERDVYVYVEGVESIYADLTKRGANVIQGLADAPYGIREFVVEDLNGFRLVFGQPI